MEKVALITGASKGLGFETAYQLGAKVTRLLLPPERNKRAMKQQKS